MFLTGNFSNDSNVSVRGGRQGRRDIVLKPEFEQSLAGNAHLIAVREHLNRGSCASASHGADRGTFPAAGDRADDGANYGSAADALGALRAAAFPGDVVVSRIEWNNVSTDADSCELERQLGAGGDFAGLFRLREPAIGVRAFGRDNRVTDHERAFQACLERVTDLIH